MRLLLTEEWPDGTYGGARTVRGTRSAPIREFPDPHAAEHAARLSAALSRPLYLRETDPIMTVLPDGYYAVLDPTDPSAMTYWRARAGRLNPWPAKAWHGPTRPLHRDAPADQGARIEWMRDWQSTYGAWLQLLDAALQADPGTARRRFATLTVRCCQCGRKLSDDTSKVLGIGPDCAGGLGPETLASLFMPAVAAAHAAQVHAGGAL